MVSISLHRICEDDAEAQDQRQWHVLHAIAILENVNSYQIHELETTTNKSVLKESQHQSTSFSTIYFFFLSFFLSYLNISMMTF